MSLVQGALFGALCAGLSVVAMGLDKRPAVPGVVEASEFRLLDADGKTRGTWSVQNGESRLVLRDSKGAARIAIKVASDPIIQLLDPQGQPSLHLSQSAGEGSDLAIVGTDGKTGIRLQAVGGGAGATLRDGSGRVRIYGLCIPITNAAELGMNDDKGKPVWKAPVEEKQNGEKK